VTVRERITAAIDHIQAARRPYRSTHVQRALDSALSELREALLTLDAMSSVDALPYGDPRRR